YPVIKRFIYDVLDNGRAMQAVRTKETERLIKSFKEELKATGHDYNESKRRLFIYAVAQQPEGLEELYKFGITEIPKLSPVEEKIYRTVRNRLDDYFTEFNAARATLGLNPINYVKNYSTYLRDENAIKYIMDQLIFSNDATMIYNMIKEPAAPYAFSRKPGVKVPFEFDFFRAFAKYADIVHEYLAVHKCLANSRLLLSPIRYTDNTGEKRTFNLVRHDPNLYSYIKNYSQFATQRLSPNALGFVFSPKIVNVINTVNRHLPMAILSFNLRSAFIQPTQARNSFLKLGLDFFGGIHDVIEDLVRTGFKPSKMKCQKSKHLQYRAMDIHVKLAREEPLFRQQLREPENFAQEAVQKLNQGLHYWERINREAVKIGTYPLVMLDYWTATTTWYGAYRKGFRQGLRGEALIRYADEIVKTTQASAALHDLSPLQRTAEGRLLTVFQTFVINEWNFLSHDIFGFHEKMPFGEKMKNISLLVLSSAAINALLEGVLGIRSPFPSPEWELYYNLQKGMDLPHAFYRALGDMVEQIPVIGPPIRWTTVYKKFLPAGLQVWGDAFQALSKALQAPGSFKDWKIEDYAVLGKLFGIAGTSQVEKMIRRINKGYSFLEALLGVRGEAHIYGSPFKGRISEKEKTRLLELFGLIEEQAPPISTGGLSNPTMADILSNLGVTLDMEKVRKAYEKERRKKVK
ncbi:MAG: hypothetical protein NC828_05030, partial [Candidatus Omnitrophica bacterium]|nr:hypothetical protein [Candidatus Omnitrophota bacterium]